MKYIVFARTNNGLQIAKELKEEGEDVILSIETEFESTIKMMESLPDKEDYLVVFDLPANEISKKIEDMGFDISFDI